MPSRLKVLANHLKQSPLSRYFQLLPQRLSRKPGTPRYLKPSLQGLGNR